MKWDTFSEFLGSGTTSVEWLRVRVKLKKRQSDSIRLCFEYERKQEAKRRKALEDERKRRAAELHMRKAGPAFILQLYRYIVSSSISA